MKLLKNIPILTTLVAGLLVGFASTSKAQIATNFYSGKYVASVGSSGTCPGSYIGYAKMTNSIGSNWLAVPPGATSAVITEATGATNTFAVAALPFGGFTHCGYPLTVSATNMINVVLYLKNQPTLGGSLSVKIVYY